MGFDLKEDNIKKKIYDQYIEAYKKGVFSFIKEEYDHWTRQEIPRKYFCGGNFFRDIPVKPLKTAGNLDRTMTGDNYLMHFEMDPQSPAQEGKQGGQKIFIDNVVREDLERWHRKNKYYMSIYLDPLLLNAFKVVRPLIERMAQNKPLSFSDLIEILQNPKYGILEKIKDLKIERYYAYDLISYLMATTDVDFSEEDKEYLKSAEQIFQEIMNAGNKSKFIPIIKRLRSLDKFKVVIILKWLANVAEGMNVADHQKDVARDFLNEFLEVFFSNTGFHGKDLLDVYATIVQKKIEYIKDQNQQLQSDEILVVPIETSASEIGYYVENKLKNLGVPFKPMLFTTAMSVIFGREFGDKGKFDKSTSFTAEGRQKALKYFEDQGLLSKKIKHVIFLDIGSTGSFGKLFSEVFEQTGKTSDLVMLSHEGYERLGLSKEYGYGVNDYLQDVQDNYLGKINLDWLAVMFEDGFEQQRYMPYYHVDFTKDGSAQMVVADTYRKWYAGAISEKIERLLRSPETEGFSRERLEAFILNVSTYPEMDRPITDHSGNQKLTTSEEKFLTPQFGSVKEFWASGWRQRYTDRPVVYLIRHMESITNVLGVTQNHYNFSPGTPHGYRQAAAMAQFLAQVPFDHFISSDSERAYETLERLRKRQGYQDPIAVDRRLAELILFPVGGIPPQIAFEVFDPKHLGLKYPMEFRNIYMQSLPDFYADVSDFYRFLEKSVTEGETVAIGTHGGSIRAQLMSAGNISPEKMFEVEKYLYPNGFDYSHVGISVMAYDKEKSEWETLVFNDASYLPSDLQQGTPAQDIAQLKNSQAALMQKRRQEFVANKFRHHPIHRDFYPTGSSSWRWNFTTPTIEQVRTWLRTYWENFPDREDRRLREIRTVLMKDLGLEFFDDQEDGRVTYPDDYTPLTLGDMRLILVPHGLTDSNVNFEVQDANADGEERFFLNETGKIQSIKGAEQLLEIIGQGSQKLMLTSSGLRRTIQTAEPFLDRRNLKESDLQIIKFSREFDAGLWSGLNPNQIRTQFSEAEYEKLNRIEEKSNFFISPIGGESLIEYLHAVKNGMSELIKNNQGKTVVMYTHAGFIRALRILFGIGQEFDDSFIDITKLRILPEDRGRPIVFNDLLKESQKIRNEQQGAEKQRKLEEEVVLVKQLYSLFHSDAFPYLYSDNLRYMLGVTHFPYHRSQLKNLNRNFIPIEQDDMLIDDSMLRFNFIVFQLEEKLKEISFLSPLQRKIYFGVLLSFYLESLEDLKSIRENISTYWDGEKSALFLKIFDLISLPLEQKIATMTTDVSGADYSDISMEIFKQILRNFQQQRNVYGEFHYGGHSTPKDIGVAENREDDIFQENLVHHGYVGTDWLGDEIKEIINEFEEIKAQQANNDDKLIVFGGSIRDTLRAKLEGRKYPRLKDVDMLISLHLTEEEKTMTEEQLKRSLYARTDIYSAHFKKGSDNLYDLLGVWVEDKGKLYPISSHPGDEYRSHFALIPEISVNRIGIYSDGRVFDPSGGINDLRQKNLRMITGIGESPHLSLNIFAVLRYIRFLFSFSEYTPDRNSLRMVKNFFSYKGHYDGHDLTWSAMKLPKAWINYRFRVLIGEIFSHAMAPDAVVKFFEDIGIMDIIGQFNIKRKTILLLAEKRKNVLKTEPDVQHGGIDFNKISVEREGSRINFNFEPETITPLLQQEINGFIPVIINIAPINSVLPLLGLAPIRDEDVELELTQSN